MEFHPSECSPTPRNIDPPSDRRRVSILSRLDRTATSARRVQVLMAPPSRARGIASAGRIGADMIRRPAATSIPKFLRNTDTVATAADRTGIAG